MDLLIAAVSPFVTIVLLWAIIFLITKKHNKRVEESIELQKKGLQYAEETVALLRQILDKK